MQSRYPIAKPRGIDEITRKDIERVVDQANRALMDLYGAILPQVEGVPTVEVINLGDTITNLVTNTITSSYIGSVTDRLRTSGGSTVVLTDDGTNQTLTGSLGELRINAAGILRLLDNVVAAGTLTIAGNTTVGGTLGVTGATTVGGNLTASGNLGVRGTTSLSGNVTAYGNLTVSSGIYGEHIIDPAVSDVKASRVIGTVYQNTAPTMKDVRVSVKIE